MVSRLTVRMSSSYRRHLTSVTPRTDAAASELAFNLLDEGVDVRNVVGVSGHLVLDYVVMGTDSVGNRQDTHPVPSSYVFRERTATVDYGILTMAPHTEDA